MCCIRRRHEPLRLCTPLPGLLDRMLLPELVTARAWTLGFGPPFHGKRSVQKPLLWPPQPERASDKFGVTSAANLHLQDNLPSPCTGPALLRLPQPVSRVSPHSAGPHGAAVCASAPGGVCLHVAHPTLPTALPGIVSVCNYVSPGLSLLPWGMDSAAAIG